MYLLLTIYSFCNLNVISWGTREVTEKKSVEEVAKEKAEAEEEAKKKAIKSKSSIFGKTKLYMNLTLPSCVTRENLTNNLGSFLW